MQRNISETKTKIIAILTIFLMLPFFANAQTVDELNQQINNKQKDIENVKKQIAIYQKNIRIKQEEAVSLKNQLSILDNQIAKAELDIKSSQIEIDKTQLEIRNTELQIVSSEDEIANQKNNLSEVIQAMHQKEQENPLQTFLLNQTISDYFNEIEYTKDIQKNINETLSGIKEKRKILITQKQSLESKQNQLISLKEDLEFQKLNLLGDNEYKNALLVQTKSSESKFQSLYQQAKQEQVRISNEVASLEREAREKLKTQTDKPQLKDAQLSWPLSSRKVTATFHDPDYPFRYIFEHPAIDIATPQGTRILAPAEGYVLKVKDAGMGYSYVALIHADGLSTVYGHVSKIMVKEDDYVAKGEVIALSGGMPGTPGAGGLTNGPHLHFEVRLNGVPVNAEDYLP